MLTLISRVGSGSYGTVYKATYHNQIVAVKRHQPTDAVVWSNCLRELDMLARIKGSPFVVDLIDVYVGDPLKEDHTSNLHFIFEYVEYSGDMFFRSPLCNPQVATLMMCQLLLGIEFCHAKSVVHRDLKPQNILVSPEGPTLKICDFGMSQLRCPTIPATPGVTTSWYRSPEICRQCDYYGSEIDMWSIGCIMYEMSTLRPLFRNIVDDTNVYDQILTNLENLRQNNEYAFTHFRELNDLLNGLIRIDPQRRYTADEALKSPLFHMYQDYIVQTRELYPPVPENLPLIRIEDTMERRWVIQYAFMILDNKPEWYTHRTLFHAIDLMDCYFEHRHTHAIYSFDAPTETHGRYLDVNMTQFYFCICIYMMEKYYSTLHYPFPLNYFVPQHLHHIDLVYGEQFELHMIKDVVNYRLYRDTLLEITSHYRHRLDEAAIKKLFQAYGHIIMWEGKSVRALYREIVTV